MTHPKNFETIYKTNYSAVQRYLVTHCPSHLLEDVTQETFFRAYKELAGFKNQSEIQTWLIAIAKNVLKEHYRSRETQKRKGIEVEVDEQLFAHEINPFHELVAEDILDCVRGVLAGLSAKLKQCMKLRLEEKSTEEIAELLKLNPGTVKSRIHKARQEFDKCR